MARNKNRLNFYATEKPMPAVSHTHQEQITNPGTQETTNSHQYTPMDMFLSSLIATFRFAAETTGSLRAAAAMGPVPPSMSLALRLLLMPLFYNGNGAHRRI